MNIYKITGISGAVAFLCGLAALWLNPREKGVWGSIPSAQMTTQGNIALIVAVISIAVFIVLLAITLIYHKVETKREGGMYEVFRPDFNVLTHSAVYDEKSDTAELKRKEYKEKHKLD